jgi:hypothetical protein
MPVRVAIVAMANKMAQIVWALMTRGEAYRVAHPHHQLRKGQGVQPGHTGCMRLRE